MIAIPVAVVVNGALVVGSTPAELRDGVIVVPLDPYVRALATRITHDAARGTIVVERGGTSVSFAVRSRDLRSGSLVRRLPIAPYLRADSTILPLAAVARALGASVTYDAAAHAVAIEVPPLPLATPTPYAAGSVEPGSSPTGPTFSPTATPQPTPTVGGMPRPRRTPIEVDPPGAP